MSGRIWPGHGPAGGPAVSFEGVSIRYEGAPAPTIHEVDIEVDEGELALVVGRTGSGKSTLLRCINGLVPHFTGGLMTGRVVVAGRDTRTHPPRELADVVGVVGQDPAAGFVAEIVEDELAYSMECLGLPGAVMRRRVEEALDLLGLADLRARPLAALSGGERQRVAIGAALTAQPRIIVLDEPTSALDPGAAEDVLAALQRLVHDLGLTVVLAEHRLERVVQYADRVIVVEGGRVTEGIPATMMVTAPVAPPVVELGRLAGWSPLPLSVRDARRAAGPLRARLSIVHAADPAPGGERPDAERSSPGRPDGEGSDGKAAEGKGSVGRRPDRRSRTRDARGVPPLAPVLARGTDTERRPAGRSDAAIVARGLSAGYRGNPVLRGIDLSARAGEVVAIMGRNGAGKSTLLRTLAGMRAPDDGTVRVAGCDPLELSGRGLIERLGLVPQDPADLLYATSVSGELADAERTAAAPAGLGARLLAELAPGIDSSAHPRDLSEGQRLALALAVVLTARPPVLLLDEPTRGLDYGAKLRLVGLLDRLRADGAVVLMATHDVELVAEVATRVVILADGEIVADGPTAQVVVGSPLFAPQVAKILAPVPILTVAQARAGLAAS